MHLKRCQCLPLPATNAVSERSCSTLRRVKTYLRSSMTQKRLNSCLVLATYKEQVDQLNLAEVANQFCFKSEHRFSILESLRTKISLESLLKVQLWGFKHRNKVVDQQKLKRTDIATFYNSFLSVFFFFFFLQLNFLWLKPPGFCYILLYSIITCILY